MSYQKQKGTEFENDTVDYLSEELGIELIREPPHGTRDVGDIYGFKVNGKKVVLECKNHRRMELSEWVDEAEREKAEAGTDIGLVVHKRKGRGKAKFGENYVTCTLETLVNLVRELSNA